MRKRAHAADDSVAPDGANESPNVPGFRTWRGVYWFVFLTFAAVVTALAIFSRVYR